MRHVLGFGNQALAAVLNWALLWFPQQTEKFLHLGYFHFWTLGQLLTFLSLLTHAHNTNTNRRAIWHLNRYKIICKRFLQLKGYTQDGPQVHLPCFILRGENQINSIQYKMLLSMLISAGNSEVLYQARTCRTGAKGTEVLTYFFLLCQSHI